MPIEKVPVVHRFGIISHNQRLELQDRLLKKAIEQATVRPYEPSSRNPYELPESFVHQFNSAKTVNAKERYEQAARKHLERLKTKAGVKVQCEVDTRLMDEVWVDLTILSQCKGQIQEASLDMLIKTLDISPFDKGNIQGLFFLAETALYWLRTDAINSPYLRSSELKLLKMASLVFLRLFYHHMVGDLRGCSLFKNRLYMYLDGLAEFQEAYSPYPNAHICLRYVIEVGKVIFLDEDLNPGEMKEADDTDRSHFSHKSDPPRSAKSAVSRSVHDLTPTLWHSLDVWRCVAVSGKQLGPAIQSLSTCGLGMALESWVDGSAALHVLGEAARLNLCVLQVLQNLACGTVPDEIQVGPHQHETANPKPVVNEEDENTDNSFEKRQEVKILEQEISEVLQQKSPRTPRKVTRESQRTQSRGVSREAATKGTGQRPNVGTELDERGNITPTTYRNSPFEDSPGIQGWQWEVAVTYTEIMSDLVINSQQSMIQKTALLGRNRSIAEVQYSNGLPPLQSAGLLDLLHFHVIGEGLDNVHHDWSWRIRYTAVQGLVHICSSLKGNKMSDGMYNMAWSALLEANSHESDERVLEALKVGQVSVRTQEKSTPHSVKSQNIGSRLADGLCKQYLPPLSVNTKPFTTKPRAKYSNPQPPTKRQPLRASLRDGTEMAALTDPPPIPDFNNRANKDLMRIVEDQWRKELQEKLRLEEEEAAQQKTQASQLETIDFQTDQSNSNYPKLSKPSLGTSLASPT